jgi:hypothetical protein
MQQPDKKVQIKIMDNLTDEELNQLITELKKIRGFTFGISSTFIRINQTSQNATS